VNAVWNVEDMACAIVTPVGMLCVAVTVLLVVVTNGSLTTEVGYVDWMAAVIVLPLPVSALTTDDTVAVPPVAAVGAAVGAMPAPQPLTTVEAQTLVRTCLGAAATLLVNAPWVQPVYCWHVA